MVVAIGIDAVEVERFKHWSSYSTQLLLKVFTLKELEYCLAIPSKSAERLAARFAVKEALYKACCSGNIIKDIPFLTFCRTIEVIKKNVVPHVISTNSLLPPEYTTRLTITHTKTTAIALVILIFNN